MRGPSALFLYHQHEWQILRHKYFGAEQGIQPLGLREDKLKTFSGSPESDPVGDLRKLLPNLAAIVSRRFDSKHPVNKMNRKN